MRQHHTVQTLGRTLLSPTKLLIDSIPRDTFSYMLAQFLEVVFHDYFDRLPEIRCRHE